jgi:hypothetical protein
MHTSGTNSSNPKTVFGNVKESDSICDASPGCKRVSKNETCVDLGGGGGFLPWAPSGFGESRRVPNGWFLTVGRYRRTVL